MKRIVFALFIVSTPVLAAEFGWKCPGGEVGVGRASPCPGGVKLYLDDMNTAQLNAYTKAQSAQDRKDELARKAESAKLKAEQDAKDAALLKLCGKLDGEPVLGMTEEQFVKCTMFGEPATKNYTVTPNGKMVQYVYRSSVWHGFAYFRNGRLTSYQF
ncbi:MAG: hypothetical protein JSR83_10110 [Proteobacteria bacterium]|nr:hypothetical protein [Pseudomonadota bacterium]